MSDPDYKKLVNKDQEFQKKIMQTKDPTMQTMMMFNYNAKKNGAHGA